MSILPISQLPDVERRVRLATPTGILHGLLGVPERATGIVILGNASGDPQYIAGNAYVGAAMREAGLATLLLDLLNGDERAADAETGALRFDVEFVASRFAGAISWVTAHPSLRSLRVGLFAGGTTAAGALVAAAQNGETVSAVACRGGRPELAAASLPAVHAPTLLLVGSADMANIGTNQRALEVLPPESRLQLVPNGRHLLEEPTSIQAVACHAVSWMAQHLTAPGARRPWSVTSTGLHVGVMSAR